MSAPSPPVTFSMEVKSVTRAVTEPSLFPSILQVSPVLLCTSRISPSPVANAPSIDAITPLSSRTKLSTPPLPTKLSKPMNSNVLFNEPRFTLVTNQLLSPRSAARIVLLAPLARTSSTSEIFRAPNVVPSTWTLTGPITPVASTTSSSVATVFVPPWIEPVIVALPLISNRSAPVPPTRILKFSNSISSPAESKSPSLTPSIVQVLTPSSICSVESGKASELPSLLPTTRSRPAKLIACVELLFTAISMSEFRTREKFARSSNRPSPPTNREVTLPPSTKWNSSTPVSVPSK